MAHFATTALIRKRAVEKGSEKHDEETSEIHGKVMKIHFVPCILFRLFSKDFDFIEPAEPEPPPALLIRKVRKADVAFV